MFLRESLPTEVVALSGAAIMLALGILPYDDAQAVLQNSAPWTIAAMFIVMGALVRTGALDVLTRMAERYAKTHPKTAVVGVIVAVMAASAVMNNTPVVVVMIPVVVQLSQTLGTKASKLLIPLSYAAIMGGSLTLIGTSTNLEGVLEELQKHFSMAGADQKCLNFEMTFQFQLFKKMKHS